MVALGWSRRRAPSLVSCCVAASIAAACAKKSEPTWYAPPGDTTKPANSTASASKSTARDGGAAQTGNATADASSGSGGGGSNSKLVATAYPCMNFDANAVHLWGGFDKSLAQWAVAPSLHADEPCINLAGVVEAQLRYDGALLYMDVLGGPIQIRVFRAKNLSWDGYQWKTGDQPKEEVIPTPACDAPDASPPDPGPLQFHMNPVDGTVIYSCRADRCDKFTGSDCLARPYYDTQGKMVFDGILIAIANDGRFLTWVKDNGWGYALYDPTTKQSTPTAYFDDMIFHEYTSVWRAHDDGFWLAVEVTDGPPWRYVMDGKGVLSPDAQYAPLPKTFSPYYIDTGGPVIDGNGDLYILGVDDNGAGAIARTSVSGDASIVYSMAEVAKTTPSYNDKKLFVRLFQDESLLITAPQGHPVPATTH